MKLIKAAGNESTLFKIRKLTTLQQMEEATKVSDRESNFTHIIFC